MMLPLQKALKGICGKVRFVAFLSLWTTLGSSICQVVCRAVGFSQTSSDPLSALVPVVLAGATCVVAKLFHKQHKQHKDLHHKQGNMLLATARLPRPGKHRAAAHAKSAFATSLLCMQVTSMLPSKSCRPLRLTYVRLSNS